MLLARHVPPKAKPVGFFREAEVEHAEDPFSAMVREVVEETGCGWLGGVYIVQAPDLTEGTGRPRYLGWAIPQFGS